MGGNDCVQEYLMEDKKCKDFINKDKFIFDIVMGKELIQECKGKSAIRLPSH